MIKRLFYAVLGFWLFKKYVLPRFDERPRAGAATTARGARSITPSGDELRESGAVVERDREERREDHRSTPGRCTLRRRRRVEVGRLDTSTARARSRARAATGLAEDDDEPRGAGDLVAGALEERPLLGRGVHEARRRRRSARRR